MIVRDKGQNRVRLDITEIIRFEITNTPATAGVPGDSKGDGLVA